MIAGNDITNIEVVRSSVRTQFDQNIVTHYGCQVCHCEGRWVGSRNCPYLGNTTGPCLFPLGTKPGAITGPSHSNDRTCL